MRQQAKKDEEQKVEAKADGSLTRSQRQRYDKPNEADDKAKTNRKIIQGDWQPIGKSGNEGQPISIKYTGRRSLTLGGATLQRKVGLDDGERRIAENECVRGAIKKSNSSSRGKRTGNHNQAQQNEESVLVARGLSAIPPGWVKVNIGRAVIVDDAKQNLFASVPAAKAHGLGTVQSLYDKGDFLIDAHGRRFPMRIVGKQMRFDAMVRRGDGQLCKIEMVHDSGASLNIMRPSDG